MKKGFKLLLTLVCTLGLFVSGGALTAGTNEPTAIQAVAETAETIDYAGQAVLDRNGDSKTMEVTLKTFIDGDTTHFHAQGFNDQNLLKARYMAINTPESTGKLEEWGKKASRFTRSKLETATSIILESDTTDWEADSTGDRYLVWVWYKAPNSTTYRNLNLELLQEGLALGSKAGNSRYGTLCTQAIAQAVELKLHVHSTEKDPDFFYGESIELDLKELRLNIAEYEGKRVAFEGVISYYVNQGVYVENYDEETQMYYGIYVYYGFSFSGESVLAVGNRVRITGVVQYYEAGDSYQVSDLKYNAFIPSDDDVRLIEKGHSAANVETTAEKFNKVVEIPVTRLDPDTQESITQMEAHKYAKLALNTSISMKNLLVKDAYTTDNGGNNDGAMTLTCEANGRTVKVRTIVLRSPDGKLVTEDSFLGKTIDVTGVVDYFSGDYQIKILSTGGIKVDGEPLFPPTASEPTPPAPSNPQEAPKSGCNGSASVPTLLVTAGLATLAFLKKQKNIK